MNTASERFRQAAVAFDGLTASWRRPAEAARAQGRPPTEVRRELAAVGLAPPGDLLAWFAWQDGAVHPEHRHFLVPNAGWTLSLRQSIAVHLELRPAIEEYCGDTTWLPILGYSHAGVTAVDCRPDGNGTASVFYYDYADGFLPAGTDLTTMLQRWNHIIASGVVRWNNDVGAPEPYTDDEYRSLPLEWRVTGLV